MSIIRSSRVLCRRLLSMVFGALVFKLSVWCGAEGLRTHNPQLHTILKTRKTKHQIPQAATFCIILSSSWWYGIMVPETCWSSNKICNKNHLLHLVGVLFPHIIETLFTLLSIWLSCGLLWAKRVPEKPRMSLLSARFSAYSGRFCNMKFVICVSLN
jgi:hypothetical protein